VVMTKAIAFRTDFESSANTPSATPALSTCARRVSQDHSTVAPRHFRWRGLRGLKIVHVERAAELIGEPATIGHPG